MQPRSKTKSNVNHPIIIAGGGTGGHLVPNIVLGTLILTHFPRAQIIQITGNQPLDHHLFNLHHVPHPIFLPTHAFANKNIWGKVRSLIGMVRHTMTCLRYFLRWKPKLVIGVGGYTSIPPILAAALLRIPIVLQEQNRIPGLANRWLAYVAKHVLMGFPDAEKYLSQGTQKKCIYSGNFNWSRLPHHPPSPCFRKGKEDGLTLLITGGSQGARSLNDFFVTRTPQLLLRYPRLNIVWQCGEKNVSQLQNKIGSERLTLLGHVANLYPYYESADVCVTRAGALTVTDVARSATPTIFVPYPHAADNHQQANAMWLAEQKAATVISETTPDWHVQLTNTLHTLLSDQSHRDTLRIQAQKVRGALPSTDVLLQILKPYTNLT